MRILFLGKRHYTNKDALRERFGRVYRLPARWSRRGHAVTLALVDYHGRAWESAEDGTMAIRSLPARSPFFLPRLSRLVAGMAPDAIVAAGDNLVGLLGHGLARRNGAASVFDAYDDFRCYGSSRLLLGWDAFDWLRRHADGTLYASQLLADEHPRGRPSLVVPNAVSAEAFAGLDRGTYRREAGIPADVGLVGYFGSMEPERGIPLLVSAVRALRAGGRPLHLLVAGRPHPDTPLPGDASDWLHYPGLVPHERVPAMMAACDVLALPYLRSPLLDTSASCKIGEYLFAGRAIAATRTPNLELNFPEQAAALGDRLAAPGSVEDLARAIALQLDDPRIVAAPAHFTWSAVADQAEAFIAGIVAGR